MSLTSKKNYPQLKSTVNNLIVKWQGRAIAAAIAHDEEESELCGEFIEDIEAVKAICENRGRY